MQLKDNDIESLYEFINNRKLYICNRYFQVFGYVNIYRNIDNFNISCDDYESFSFSIIKDDIENYSFIDSPIGYELHIKIKNNTDLIKIR